MYESYKAALVMTNGYGWVQPALRPRPAFMMKGFPPKVLSKYSIELFYRPGPPSYLLVEQSGGATVQEFHAVCTQGAPRGQTQEQCAILTLSVVPARLLRLAGMDLLILDSSVVNCRVKLGIQSDNAELQGPTVDDMFFRTAPLNAPKHASHDSKANVFRL